MPLLVCSAQRCVYNDGMYCSKGEITVEGTNADTAAQTCCGSFRERTSENAKNSMGSPSQTSEVACEACECMHNNNRKCDAEKINIAGASACCCTQTECNTFRK